MCASRLWKEILDIIVRILTKYCCIIFKYFNNMSCIIKKCGSRMGRKENQPQNVSFHSSMWLVYVVLCAAAVAAVTWRVRNRRLFRLHARLRSGITPLPVIGHAYLFIGDNERIMKGIMRLAEDATRRGGLNTVWILHKLVLNVTDAETAVIILKNFHEKGNMLEIVKELYGDSSIFASVDIWRTRKRLYLAPMLTPRNVNGFFDTFVKYSGLLMEELRKQETQPERAETGTPQPVSVFSYFMTNTLDNAIEATFGVNSRFDSVSPLQDSLDEIMKIGGIFVTNFWLQNKFLFGRTSLYKAFYRCVDRVNAFVNETIQRRQDETLKGVHEKQRETGSGGTCYLDVMVRAGAREAELLRQEAVGLLIAAADTTALSAAFAALMLARHPPVQDALCQELEDIFGDSDRPVTPEDLSRMRYMEAVIKEAQRLFPPAPIILREADKDLLLPSGAVIPKGCLISINIYGVNRNPQYWGADADEFRPERFLEGPLAHPAAFLTFSHGPRGCPGYMFGITMIKTNLSALLRRYRVLPSPRAPARLRLLYYIMMKTDDFDVLLEPRTINVKT